MLPRTKPLQSAGAEGFTTSSCARANSVTYAFVVLAKAMSFGFDPLPVEH